MMGDSKPNFALDLSNDGIALWHRGSDGGWQQLGTVRLDDPKFSDQVAALRDQALGAGGTARARRAIIRIPRSEVLLSKVRYGVFEGEAALRHVHKQIAELTPYSLEEIVFDLGDKGVGNMAPVGIVARQTLEEAEGFARTHGFAPAYFTTQYGEKEFPREPRFVLAAEKAAAKPMWFVPWVAAAAVGLTIGYFGYSYLSRPAPDTPVAIAESDAPSGSADEPAAGSTAQTTTAGVAGPEQETGVATEDIAAQGTRNSETETAASVAPADTLAPADTVQLGLQDIAPNLPPVLASLATPETTAYPELLTGAVTRNRSIDAPRVVRLQTETSDEPQVSVKSDLVKTNALQIAEARRDLPEVSVNEEIARLIEEDLALLGLTAPDPVPPLRLAALTAPDQVADPLLVNPLPPVAGTAKPVDDATTQPADRPPRPPSLVTADPGTLTPTPEGTLGPDNILIFSGTPPNAPLARPGTVAPPPPPVNPLAGFRPRLRPAGLAPEAVAAAALAEAEAAAQAAAASTAGTEAPDTELAATQVPAAEDAAQETAQAGTETPDETPVTAPETPSLLALADPSLRTLRARARPEALRVLALEPEAPAEPPSLLDLADPSLRGLRAPVRPEGLAPIPDPALATEAPDEDGQGEPAPQTDLIATAIENDAAAQAVDDTIAQDTAEQAVEDTINREAIARAIEDAVEEDAEAEARTDLLALADPSLVGKKARNRPTGLRIIDTRPQGLLALADPSLSGKRSRARPRGLRILAVAEPEPVVEPEAEPDNTLSSATRLAVASSPKPKRRPARLALVAQRVAAAQAAQTRADSASGGGDTGGTNAGSGDARSASASASDGRDGGSGTTRATARTPRAAVGTAKPAPGPTSATVARAATEKSRFRKSRMSLVGIFGTPSKRRALVRLPTGRYVKVQKGDKVSGWQVSAIGESSLRIKKGNRDQVLRIP